MRFVFIFVLLLICLVAVSLGEQQTKNQKSNKQVANSLSISDKPVAKRSDSEQPAVNKPIAKRNGRKRNVLIDRAVKRQRSVVKSKPQRKTVRAIHKFSRKVVRAKPSARANTLKRKRANIKKKFAKQEEADIENADEGFTDDKIDQSIPATDTESINNQSPESLPVLPENTNNVQNNNPSIISTNNLAGLPNNFSFPGLSQAAKNGGALGAGFAQTNGPGIAFGAGFVSTNGQQSSAGGFGASFNAPNLVNNAQPESNSDYGGSEELAQYRRPRRVNRKQDKYLG